MFIQQWCIFNLIIFCQSSETLQSQNETSDSTISEESNHEEENDEGIDLKPLVNNSKYNISVFVEHQPPLVYIDQLEKPKGILIDIWEQILMKIENSSNIMFNNTYIFSNLSSDVILQFYSNYDMEKGFTYITDQFILNYSVFEPTESVLQENYLLLFPSLLVKLIKKIVWELLLTISIILIPWIFLNANILSFFLYDKHKQTTYLEKLIASVQILAGNKKTSLGTLVYKIVFITSTFFISTMIYIDFIYVIATTISKTSYHSLNDLIMNQASVCYVHTDPFIEQMVEVHRDLTFVRLNRIDKCLDYIQNEDDMAFFVSEFVFGEFLRDNQNYNNFFKYSVKQNSFKSYHLLINVSQPEILRTAINNTINIIKMDKYDLKVREVYLEPVLYKQKSISSLISSNNTFLLTSFLVSIFLLLLIQISSVWNQIILYKNDVPFKFQRGKIPKQKIDNLKQKIDILEQDKMFNNLKMSTIKSNCTLENEQFDDCLFEQKSIVSSIRQRNVSTSSVFQFQSNQMNDQSKIEEEAVQAQPIKK